MMNESPGRGQDAGLCARCVHAQIVESAKGSRFHLCRLSAVDKRYPKYPRLPVLRCPGFVERER
jgi:hypothetical protein